MSAIYEAEQHTENVLKCWDKYFNEFDRSNDKVSNAYDYCYFIAGRLRRPDLLQYRSQLSSIKSELLHRGFTHAQIAYRHWWNSPGTPGHHALLEKCRAVNEALMEEIPGEFDEAVAVNGISVPVKELLPKMTIPRWLGRQFAKWTK